MLLMMVFAGANAQKFKKIDFDKFSKSITITTKKDVLFNKGKYEVEFEVRYSNGHYSFPAELHAGGQRKWDETSTLSLLLDNDEIVVLHPAFGGVDSTFNTYLTIDEKDVDKLKNHVITDVRMSFVGGYFDCMLKKDRRDVILRHLKLIDSELLRRGSK